MFRSPSAYLEFLQNREQANEQESVHKPEVEREVFDYPSDESSEL